MSSYSDYLKTAKRKDLEFFFGPDLKMSSGRYFRFKRVLVSDVPGESDTIIVVTNNIMFIKEKPVLIVNDNAGLYLKDWQVRKVSSHSAGINAYAVKLTRKYFKPYTFKFNFTGYHFEEPDTFDKLLEIAREQESENLALREGWSKN